MEGRLIVDVLGHADPDGRIVAALTRRKMGVKYEVQDIPMMYCNFPQILEDFSKKDLYGHIVIIADLGFQEDVQELIKRISSKAHQVVWVDHHPGTWENQDFLRGLGIEVYCTKERVCASRIFQRRFLPRNEYAAFLAGVAQVSDYKDTKDIAALWAFQTTPNDLLWASRVLGQLISLYCASDRWHDLQKLTEDLSAEKNKWLDGDGNLLSPYNDHLEEYEERAEEKRDAIWGTQELIAIGDLKMATVFVNALLPQKEIVEEVSRRLPNFPVIVFVFGSPTNDIWLNSNRGESGFPVFKFAQFMGGGGKPATGAFSLGKGKTKHYPVLVNPKNYYDILRLLRKDLIKFIKKAN